MSAETTKVVLMILMLGGLVTATRVPAIPARRRPHIGPLMARMWSALVPAHHVLQPVPVKRRPHGRAPR